VEELSRLLDVWGLERALLVPFNPSLGQRISNGRYSIGGTPLHQTGFARDPEYPALTADVLELLGPRDGVDVSYSESADDLAGRGIVVTGGMGRDDLLALADRLDGRTLAAGAAEFFDAILQRRFGVHQPRPRGTQPGERGKTLLILGSRAATSRATVTAARDKGLPVLSMPRELYDRGDAEVMDRWTASVVQALVGSDVVVIAVGEADGVTPMPAVIPIDLLPTRLAELSSATLARWSAELQIVVSGGTTASAIVRRLGWDLLRVTGEIAPGVVTLGVPGSAGISITVKPGSYGWPVALARALELEGAV
jgi:uncharacterized protein YgbK (DUF1537 family)